MNSIFKSNRGFTIVTCTILLLLAEAQIALAYPADGLLAAYLFNGNPDDSSGNGNHGTAYGATTLIADRFGNAGSAYKFNSKDDYVAVPGMALTGTSFTVSAWTNSPDTVINRGVFLRRGNHANYTLYVMNTATYPASVHFNYSANPPPNYVPNMIIANNAAILGEWLLVTGVYDRDQGETRLYVNGVLVGNNPQALDPHDPGGSLEIGNWYGTRNGWNYEAFVGDVDDVLIYNRALSDAEVQGLYDLLPPELRVATEIPAAENETVEVGVDFVANGQPVAATAFSIDYDETCLSFDDADADADGIPDALTVQVPGGFSVTAFHDLGDSDGEIDISITDLAPPIATFPDGTLVTVAFTATCSPELGSSLDAAVLFSTDPAATFSDDLARDVDGSTSGGSVRIYPGPRGDCNSTGTVAAADLIADVLEIFDGDGNFWGDVPGGTFPGSPVGCDANADAEVTAGDVSCTILLIFGDDCGAARRWPPMAAWKGPVLAIDGSPRLQPGSLIRVPVRLSSRGHALSSVAFSLDLERAGLRFVATDADRDGVPDAVRFPAGTPWLAQVRFDITDRDGELDVALAAEPGAILADGVLLDLYLEVRRSGRLGKGLRFSEAPAASFGDLTGRGVPGRAVVDSKPARDVRPELSPRTF